MDSSDYALILSVTSIMSAETHNLYIVPKNLYAFLRLLPVKPLIIYIFMFISIYLFLDNIEVVCLLTNLFLAVLFYWKKVLAAATQWKKR